MFFESTTSQPILHYLSSIPYILNNVKSIDIMGLCPYTEEAK